MLMGSVSGDCDYQFMGLKIQLLVPELIIYEKRL